MLVDNRTHSDLEVEAEPNTLEKYVQKGLLLVIFWFTLCSIILYLAWFDYRKGPGANLPDCTEISKILQLALMGLVMMIYSGLAVFDPGYWFCAVIFTIFALVAWPNEQYTIMGILPLMGGLFCTYMIPYFMLAMEALLLVVCVLMSITDFFGSASVDECKNLIIKQSSRTLYDMYAAWNYTVLIICSFLIIMPAALRVYKNYYDNHQKIANDDGTAFIT